MSSLLSLPTLPEFLTVLAMASATYSTRICGWLLMHNRKVSPNIRTMLEAAPGCVMISIVAPYFMTTDPIMLISLAVVVLSACRFPLIVTMVLGIFTNAALTHLAGTL